MGTVYVRRLDDDVVKRLKLRAAANNRSLEGEARHILEQAAEYNIDGGRAEAFQALSERLRKGTGELFQTPSDVLIREDRESGHRDI